MEKIFNVPKVDNTTSGDQKKLEGNAVLNTGEKLVSKLVKPTDTYANVSFTLETVGKRDTVMNQTIYKHN